MLDMLKNKNPTRKKNVLNLKASVVLETETVACQKDKRTTECIDSAAWKIISGFSQVNLTEKVEHLAQLVKLLYLCE